LIFFLSLENSEKVLKIKPDEIIELARTYYNIDELYQVTVGPK